jgi:hypothetical protein
MDPEEAKRLVEADQYRKCDWCGAQFTGDTAQHQLNAHLAFCEKRIWKKIYTVGNCTYVVYMNPVKRVTYALEALCKKFQHSLPPYRKEDAFLVSLITLKQIGVVRAIEISKKTDPSGKKLKEGEVDPDTLKHLEEVIQAYRCNCEVNV